MSREEIKESTCRIPKKLIYDDISYVDMLQDISEIYNYQNYHYKEQEFEQDKEENRKDEDKIKIMERIIEALESNNNYFTY